MNDTNTPAPSNGLTPELPVELPPAPAATKNVLGTRHLIKLADWCRENRPACEKETNPKLATIATAVLGFTVTGANIANALEALDIPKWKPEEEKPLEEQFIVIRGTMQNVLDTLALLSGRVTRLEEKEGKIDRIDTGDRVDAQALPWDAPTDPGA